MMPVVIKIIDRGEYTKVKDLNGKVELFLKNLNDSKHNKTYMFNFSSENDKQSFSANKIPDGGKYRIYQVQGASKLTNGTHVELLLARSKWQGYLLSKNDLLIPTTELITLCSCNEDCPPEYSSG